MASERDDRPERSDDGLRRASVEWPSPRQWIRQVAIVAVLAAVWGGALTGLIRMPAEFIASNDAPPSAARAARMAARAARDSAEARGEVLAAADTTVTVDTASTPPSPPKTSAGPAEQPVRVAATRSDRPTPPAADARTQSAAKPPSAGPPKTDDPAVRRASTTPSSTTTERSEAEGGREARPRPAAETLDLLMEEPDSTAANVSFAKDVSPILERRCVQCHGGEREEGGRRIEEGLDLRTHKGLMLGSTWGTVIEPGDAVASYLLELVLSGEMPDEGPRLLPGEIRIIRNWILAGAHAN
jgi:hypothetical protein